MNEAGVPPADRRAPDLEVDMRFVWLGIVLLTTSCMSSEPPPVRPPVRCDHPWPPVSGPANTPPTFDAAVGQILACLSTYERDVIRKETEPQHGVRTHMAAGLAIRNAWIRPDGSLLQQDLRRLGFEDPDDMSAAILSGVWHRAHSQPMDLMARSACLRAWNSEARLAR